MLSRDCDDEVAVVVVPKRDEIEKDADNRV